MKTDLPIIAAMIGSSKKYIRFNDSSTGERVYVAEYCDTPEAATQFTSLQQAEETIPKIYNHLDRNFKAEVVTIDVKPVSLEASTDHLR